MDGPEFRNIRGGVEETLRIANVMRCWFRESRGFGRASVGRTHVRERESGPSVLASIDTRVDARRRRRRIDQAKETWETAALDVSFEFQENSFSDATGFALANTGGWVPNG